tara:strand:- start:234 stop:1094 length:861 start_codon:yes stop_codon:yes gene_type:complete
MEYNQFVEVFERRIFANSYSKLLTSLAKNPDRFVGIFRSSKPLHKLSQNLSQSREIKFGDAFEEVIELYLSNNGFSIKEKNLTHNGNSLRVDQYFERDNHVYFAEQKVRDDHDSTKKTGQMDNFLEKERVITHENPGKSCKGFFYFIDPSLKKNRNYYYNRLKEESIIASELSYGSEFFDSIEMTNEWNEIITHLTIWRDNLPDMLNLNFDTFEGAFDEVKELQPSIWKKLFTHTKIIEEIFPIIFPNGTLLNNIYRDKINVSSWIEVSQTIKNYLTEKNQFFYDN